MCPSIVVCRSSNENKLTLLLVSRPLVGSKVGTCSDPINKAMFVTHEIYGKFRSWSIDTIMGMFY